MDEKLYVVDENDNILRSEVRKVVHSSDIWHRGVHIILRNDHRQVILQLRAPSKDKFPNKLDVSISEHVAFGESYEEAARRGLLEEFGVETRLCELVHFRMLYGPYDFTVGKLFTGDYDGEFKQSDEISKIVLIEEKELLEKLKREKSAFTPWAMELLKYYFGQPNELFVFKP